MEELSQEQIVQRLPKEELMLLISDVIGIFHEETIQETDCDVMMAQVETLLEHLHMIHDAMKSK